MIVKSHQRPQIILQLFNIPFACVSTYITQIGQVSLIIAKTFMLYATMCE